MYYGIKTINAESFIENQKSQSSNYASLQSRVLVTNCLLDFYIFYNRFYFVTNNLDETFSDITSVMQTFTFHYIFYQILFENCICLGWRY